MDDYCWWKMNAKKIQSGLIIHHKKQGVFLAAICFYFCSVAMLMFITTILDRYKPRLLCPAAAAMKIYGWRQRHQSVDRQNQIYFPFLHESKIRINSIYHEGRATFIFVT